MTVGLPEQPQVLPPEPASAPVPPAHPPERHGLHWTGRTTLAAAPLAFLALAWGAGAYLHNRLAATDGPSGNKLLSGPIPTHTPSGPAVYAEHCARCHGANGDGRGIAQLTTPARYFGYEQFKFASTANAIPTDDDLLAVLRRGIPGSSMPSFANLPEGQLRAVIDHVRRLTRAGRYEWLAQKAKKEFDDGEGDAPNPAVLHAKAFEQTRPGTPVPAPADLGPGGTDSVKRGRAVYEKVCLSCHGPKGEGDGPQVATMKDTLGRPIRPRNLTLGLYKGGGEVADLHTRIMLGIPGTGMPASSTLPAGEVADLVHYIRSLAPPRPVKDTGPAMTASN